MISALPQTTLSSATPATRGERVPNTRLAVAPDPRDLALLAEDEARRAMAAPFDAINSAGDALAAAGDLAGAERARVSAMVAHMIARSGGEGAVVVHYGTKESGYTAFYTAAEFRDLMAGRSERDRDPDAPPRTAEAAARWAEERAMPMMRAVLAMLEGARAGPDAARTPAAGRAAAGVGAAAAAVRDASGSDPSAVARLADLAGEGWVWRGAASTVRSDGVLMTVAFVGGRDPAAAAPGSSRGAVLPDLVV